MRGQATVYVLNFIENKIISQKLQEPNAEYSYVTNILFYDKRYENYSLLAIIMEFKGFESVKPESKS